MPDLVVLFGPPASGKAAIGSRLAARTGYRFFHNHLTADPAAALFGWGTATFVRMTGTLRDLLLEEAAADPTIPGVVMTFVWAFDVPADTAFVERTAALFRRGGGRVVFVELLASLQARMAREGTPFRTSLKPMLGPAEAARARQIEFDRKHRMNSPGVLPLPHPHLVLDTEAVPPEFAVQRIVDAFGFATPAG